jgi:hypothetical protein
LILRGLVLSLNPHLLKFHFRHQIRDWEVYLAAAGNLAPRGHSV